MPFSGGTYTGLSNSFNDAVNGTKIDPIDWNELFSDIETAFNSVFPFAVPTGVVSQGTATGTGYWKFYKSHTSGSDDQVVNMSAFWDANLGGAGTQGVTLNLYGGTGYNATATGNAHVLAIIHEVRNCSRSGSTFMEPCGEFSWVGAQWLDSLGGSTPTAYTNGGISYWGKDLSVVGPNAGQESYLSGITQYVAKYHATSTIDSTHMGTNGFAICTLPSSGPNYGSRAGQTAYAIDDGVVVTGYAGAVNSNPADGNAAAATVGFTTAFRAGGANGAGWTHQKTYSKLGTAFQGLDYTSYGLDLYRAHPSGALGAIYVRSGAGTVGIWSTPTGLATRPLTVGMSNAGEMYVQVTNTSTSASAVAGYEMISDLGTSQLFTASVAAGSYTTLTTPGDLFLLSSGSSKKVQLGTNNTGRVKITDTATSPVTSDGNALGTSTLMWSDLFLASGAVINFDNGDVTLTHSADTLTVAGGQLNVSGTLQGSVVRNTSYLDFNAQVLVQAQSDGVLALLNNAATSFGRLQFGGTSSSFPAIKRNSAQLDIRLADDSTYANVAASGYGIGASGGVPFVLTASAVNMNSVADTSFAITLPPGFTRYRVLAIVLSHASTDLTAATTVQFGLFTSTGGGGTGILTATSATVSATADATNNNLQFQAPTLASASFTASPIYFRVTTAHGSAATADVALYIQPVL